MVKTIFIMLLIALLIGCGKKQEQVLDCPAKPCTMEFRSITVQFKDKNGNVLEVKNYSAVNQRTKENLVPTNQVGINEAGYYTIVNDNTLRKLSTDGDDVRVVATHPTTGQTKTANLKISGGCNCHVARLSGPETITFD